MINYNSFEELEKYYESIDYTAIREYIKRQKIDVIKSSKDAYAVAMKDLPNHIVEHMGIILLNNRAKVLLVDIISTGSYTRTIADFKIMAKKALLNNATAIIIFHNHPSGNPLPSEIDINITKKLKEQFEIIDIIFYDHIILTQETYYSINEEGHL